MKLLSTGSPNIFSPKDLDNCGLKVKYRFSLLVDVVAPLNSDNKDKQRV